LYGAHLGLLRDGLRLVTEEAQGSGAPSFISFGYFNWKENYTSMNRAIDIA